MFKKGSGKIDVDSEAIKKLAALLEETGVGEIEIEQDGQRLRVSRGGGAIMHAPMMASSPAVVPAVSEPAVPAAAAGPHPGTVNSPMVGTVYVSPKPGDPAFVKVGDTVKEGQTLLIVEAMKTMNPIAAPKAGKVHSILISDASPVEFGQPLIVIE